MQRYRVECNFGSRYFSDLISASKYYANCVKKHLDAELWLVTYELLDEGGYLATQLLVEFSGTSLPKF